MSRRRKNERGDLRSFSNNVTKGDDFLSPEEQPLSMTNPQGNNLMSNAEKMQKGTGISNFMEGNMGGPPSNYNPEGNMNIPFTNSHIKEDPRNFSLGQGGNLNSVVNQVKREANSIEKKGERSAMEEINNLAPDNVSFSLYDNGNRHPGAGDANLNPHSLISGDINGNFGGMHFKKKFNDEEQTNTVKRKKGKGSPRGNNELEGHADTREMEKFNNEARKFEMENNRLHNFAQKGNVDMYGENLQGMGNPMNLNSNTAMNPNLGMGMNPSFSIPMSPNPGMNPNPNMISSNPLNGGPNINMNMMNPQNPSNLVQGNMTNVNNIVNGNINPLANPGTNNYNVPGNLTGGIQNGSNILSNANNLTFTPSGVRPVINSTEDCCCSVM